MGYDWYGSSNPSIHSHPSTSIHSLIHHVRMKRHLKQNNSYFVKISGWFANTCTYTYSKNPERFIHEGRMLSNFFLHCRTITNYAVWRIMNNRIKDLPDRFRQYLGEYLKARNCFALSNINLDRLSIIVYFLKIKINSQFSSKLLILNTVCTIRLLFWYILHNRSCTVPPTFAPDGVSAWT